MPREVGLVITCGSLGIVSRSARGARRRRDRGQPEHYGVMPVEHLGTFRVRPSRERLGQEATPNDAV